MFGGALEPVPAVKLSPTHATIRFSVFGGIGEGRPVVVVAEAVDGALLLTAKVVAEEGDLDAPPVPDGALDAADDDEVMGVGALDTALDTDAEPVAGVEGAFDPDAEPAAAVEGALDEPTGVGALDDVAFEDACGDEAPTPPVGFVLGDAAVPAPAPATTPGAGAGSSFPSPAPSPPLPRLPCFPPPPFPPSRALVAMQSR